MYICMYVYMVHVYRYLSCCVCVDQRIALGVGLCHPFPWVPGIQTQVTRLIQQGHISTELSCWLKQCSKHRFFLYLMSPPPCSLCMVYACLYLKAVFKNSCSPCSVASAALILEVELPSLDLDIFG